ncbi:MAG: DUF4476 domain-containing protein [Bacteroidetes bacterium]|nr:MAG: DUF4476 domain-containing protein [Bacteroidota bacterium]
MFFAPISVTNKRLSAMPKIYFTALFLFHLLSLSAADLAVTMEEEIFSIEIPGRVARTAFKGQHEFRNLPNAPVTLYIYFTQGEGPLVFTQVPVEAGKLTRYHLAMGEEGYQLQFSGSDLLARQAPSAPAVIPVPSYQSYHEDPYEDDAELMADLMRELSYKSGDNSRLALMRQVLPGMRIRSSDVLSLMQLLSFESNRKALAIEACGQVIDPQNYFLVSKAFHFSGSVEEVARQMIARGPMFSADEGYTYPAAEADFVRALEVLGDQPFEQTRLLMGKWIILSMPLDSRQVARIMRRFNFDSSRLEIAKFAWPHVLDPRRYFTVSSSFDFESNAAQLQAFTSRSR